MTKGMTKADWLNRAIEDITAGNGLTRYEDVAPKEVAKEFNRIAKILYREFNDTEIKFRGKFRQTDIYAETYRLMMNIPTSTQEMFTNNLQLKGNIDFEKTYVNERLNNMGRKYGEVADYIKEYNENKISLQQLNDKIADFKKTNEQYLKESYR